MEIKRKKFQKKLKELGLTGYSLGKRLGLSKAHVYMWLYGKMIPSVENLIKLKEILNVSGDEILEMFSPIKEN